MDELENGLSGSFMHGDYKAKLNGIIDGLYSVVKTISTEDMVERVRLLTDTYIEETGERPDVTALERLATLILNDTYTDNHPDKMAREEYPIMTETQRGEREKDEIPLQWADEVGSDGLDHRPQTRDNKRKMRDVSNGHLRDKKVHARNKARRKKYREFTKTQPVTTYFLPPTRPNPPPQT